ncbi:hypothetical protein pv_256 [Pithovirus sibericum]|uniref:Uncharacterized protein n=1 Tax=Pithovirus sibericum TaxID=1450746 RepID=W5S4Y2_9VIRU|nr:hypothetical protein pv_256 [Pithovirus sibericum]AHH01823.1 hypothetical protein pv_256 [Pithovirus sibericum]
MELYRSVVFWSRQTQQNHLFLLYFLDLPVITALRREVTYLSQYWSAISHGLDSSDFSRNKGDYDEEFVGLFTASRQVYNQIAAAAATEQVSSFFQQYLAEYIQLILSQLNYFEALYLGTMTQENELRMMALITAEIEQLALDIYLSSLSYQFRTQISENISQLYSQSENPTCELDNLIGEASQNLITIASGVERGEGIQTLPASFFYIQIDTLYNFQRRARTLQRQCPVVPRDGFVPPFDEQTNGIVNGGLIRNGNGRINGGTNGRIIGQPNGIITNGANGQINGRITNNNGIQPFRTTNRVGTNGAIRI